MKIDVHDSYSLTVSDFAAPGFEVLGHPEDKPLRALQMFAAAMGRCTFKVIEHYGQRFEADASVVRVTVRWTVAESPRRIDTIAMDVVWPGLPEDRVRAVQRVAARCTLHSTLAKHPEIDTRVLLEEPT